MNVVTVKNPRLVAMEITRSLKGDGDRKLTTYESGFIVAADQAQNVVRDLNGGLAPPREGSKTARKYVVLSADEGHKNAVPVIVDASAWAERKALEAKRTALEAIPESARAALGLPAPDAADDVLKAWNPNGAPAKSAAPAKSGK